MADASSTSSDEVKENHQPSVLEGAEIDAVESNVAVVIEGGEEEPRNEALSAFEVTHDERKVARKNWGFVIIGLFCLSSIGTLALLAWAFYIDQAIIFSDVAPVNVGLRIITADVVIRLIDATIFQVGAAAAGIIGWAFFGTKVSDFFKRGR